MLFSVAFGVPEKSVFTRLFRVFATDMLANFQDRLVMTASITLRKRQIRLHVLKYIITKWPYCQERHEKICIFLKLLLQFLVCYGIMDKRWWFMPAAHEL